MCRFSLVRLAAALALFAGLAPAQVWVELIRVPDEVTGSLKDGRNLVVTAAVRGTDVVDVWLAVDPQDSKRAPLTRSGPELWQINLASGRAAELLETYGEGSVAVHARTADGRTASSVAIRFDVPESRRERSARIVQVVAIDGEGRRFRSGVEDEQWLVPEDVDRIEVRLWPKDREASVDAAADDRRWRLRRDDEWTAELEVTEEIAKAWRRSGVLTLRHGDDHRVRLRAIPRELSADERLRFTVGQRETLELPGSGGALEVSLGDITAGQVRVRIQTGDDRVVVRTRSMRELDRLRFEHGGESYVLELESLVNLIIGHDYAEFEVWKPSTEERDG